MGDNEVVALGHGEEVGVFCMELRTPRGPERGSTRLTSRTLTSSELGSTPSWHQSATVGSAAAMSSGTDVASPTELVSTPSSRGMGCNAF